MSMSDLVKRINTESAAAGLDIKATYDPNADRFYINATVGVGDEAKFDISGDTQFGADLINKLTGSSVGVNQKAESGSTISRIIKVDDTTTMSELVTQINGSGLNLKANYDSNLDRFFINATQMGANGSFEIFAVNDNGADLINKLKIAKEILPDDPNYPIGHSPDDPYYPTIVKGDKIEATAVDSKIKLDNTNFNFSTNDFSIAGLNFSLKDTGTTSIDVKADSAKLVENVKSIVESYNKLIELITGKTSEKIYRDYGPLTDEQKKEMTEKEIALWEEKAKSGVLRNDTILTSLATQMRTAVYGSYKTHIGELGGGRYDILASIGIATTNYQDKGKLTLDEDKLLKALEEDPDAVAKLFSGTKQPARDTDGNIIYENGKIKYDGTDGVMASLRNVIDSAMKQMSDKGGAGKIVDTESSWAKALRKYNDQLDNMLKKMKTEENRYYMQFATLEKTLSSMNNSSSYMLSMFNGQ